MFSINLSRLIFGTMILAMTSLILSGCVISNVTRFHDSQALQAGKTFIVLPYDKQKGSLEFRQYAALVSNSLKAAGYRKVQNGKRADYAVFFNYGIDDGRTVVSSYPIYGSTGGGTTYHSGTVSTSGGGSSSYSGTSRSTSSRSVVGSGVSSDVVYARFFTLDIIDLKKSSKENIVKVFEGKVKSTGSSGSFSIVGGCLIRSLFDGFPGENGESVRVRVNKYECNTTPSE